MPYQYTYIVEYIDTSTGLISVWNSRTPNKRAALDDFKKLFGNKPEIQRCFLPTPDEIKQGISIAQPKSINSGPSLKFYSHYCPKCLEIMAHTFLDYEHELNDLMEFDCPPVVARRKCNSCGSIHLHFYEAFND